MTDVGRGYRRFGGLLAGVGILISIIVVVMVVGDLRELRSLWDALRWQSLVCLVLLAIVNHGLRYWRWELLLKQVSSRNIKRSTAILLFSTGSLLIFTPARVGEVAKSVYTRDFFGIPMATSLPILVAERIADVAVMALLAGIGLLLLGEPPNLVLAGIILGVAILAVVLRRPLLEWGARCKIARLWAGSSSGQMLSLASASQLSLFAPRTLGTNLALGTSAWAVEVAIYFFSLSAVGVPMDSHLFILALAVFPLASLGGSISLLPGGLGVTEGGLTGLAILMGGLSQEMAVLSALLSRVAILGVVVLVGFVSMALLHRVPRP